MHTPNRSAAIAALLLCILLASLSTYSATPALAEQSSTSPLNSTINYNCPEDCHCVLSRHTHQQFLHAKCSSLNGLLSSTPLDSTLPIHSIDLSYLKLTRLSHALEKLRDVTSVDLSHNELHEIGHLGRRIKKLNLKNNRLTSAKLSKLPQHVQVLNLQHNDITQLPLEFTKLIHLQTLELSNNQINCSCDTLEVRNWLQERHVFMESPVKCSQPAEYKGKSWLQVKQADVCEKEKRGWYAEEDENELMLGDQPVEGSGDNEDEDELGKAFMPIERGSSAKSAEQKLNDVEGSGDLSEMNLPLELTITTDEPAMLRLSEEATTVEPEEEDGSGSGAGILIIPHLGSEPIVEDDFDAPSSSETDNADDLYDNKPVEQPATQSPVLFGAGMGIFDDGDKDKLITDGPVQEEPIVPVVHHELAASNLPDEEIITAGPYDVTDGEIAKSDAVKTAKVAKNDDSNATYFLLGVIGLIVVGLILFVGIKRCKQNRSAANDAENPRQTELLDMDKKNPGKPLRNGNEHAPLIGEKTKSDLAKPINGAGKKPYDAGDVRDGPAQQQPLLNGSGNGNANTPAEAPQQQQLLAAPAPEPNSDPAAHEYYPITPRYPTPKSPRASKYAQYPQGEQNNNNVANDAYLPSSPKSGRYSPVYSPETGRVKIKLTETPKPKTPMLVTRSKSNAGDIITTPVHPVTAATNEMPAVHVPPVGGAVNGLSH